jgi:hypothetical protein
MEQEIANKKGAEVNGFFDLMKEVKRMRFPRPLNSLDSHSQVGVAAGLGGLSEDQQRALNRLRCRDHAAGDVRADRLAGRSALASR